MVNLQNGLAAVIGGVVAYPPRDFPPRKMETPGFARLHAVSPVWDKFATVLPFRPSQHIFVTGFFHPPVLGEPQGKFLNWVIPDRGGRETKN